MKFEHTKVWGFRHAIRGMRNPLESYDKSDSHYESDEEYFLRTKDIYDDKKYIIGKNDMQLAQNLIRAGGSHRKFLRQIFVSVDITAPLYWWKEMDQYKVGTVTNSCSTMHTLSKSPITFENFEMDDFDDFAIREDTEFPMFGHANYVSTTINYLENLRKKYLETKNKKYWKELIRWLPESWLQKRTVTMNYENLLGICSKDQRRFHKLNEWSGIDNPELPNFISWARSLPYAQELIFIDELENS